MELKDFEAAPAVPVSVAASMLGVQRHRVYVLLAEGKLHQVSWDGGVAVSIASIKARLRRLRKAKLPGGGIQRVSDTTCVVRKRPKVC